MWAEDWGPKVHSLFVQIQLPEPRDLVTEPDSRGFPGLPWSKARSTWLCVQRSGRWSLFDAPWSFEFQPVYLFIFIYFY